MNILFVVIVGVVFVVLALFIAFTWESLAGYIVLLYTLWPIYKISSFVKVPSSPVIARSTLKLSPTEIKNIKKHKDIMAKSKTRLSIVSAQDLAKRKDGFYQERTPWAINYNKEWSQLIDKIKDLEDKIYTINQKPYDRIDEIESLIDDRYKIKKQKFIAKSYFILVVILLFLDYTLLEYHYYPVLLAIPLSYIFVFLYKNEELDNFYMILFLAKKELDEDSEIIVKDYDNNRNNGQTECNEDPESFFDIILKDPGKKEIEVIKIVRAMTGLTLEEVRNVTTDTSKPFMKRVNGIKACEVKKKLEAFGAAVRFVKKRKSKEI